MRYTKKSEKFISAYEWNRELPTKTFAQFGMNKLGQLEDLEEDLGIDLAILIKALKNGIYTIEDGYIPSDFLLLKYNKKFSRLVDNRPSAIAGGTCFYLQGYGTLWALTKEELL